jgi:hypothetical protein
MTLFSKNKEGLMGLLVVVFIILWSILALRLSSPPEVVPASSTNEFSAERAVEYLKIIAAEPHSSGTPAHAKVRDYILEFSKQQGLETELQELTGLQVRGTFARAGRAQNILARLKGTSSGKTILVMSHYDSQPNTPGATDDGAGVVAMMEVMKMLKREAPLKNDVLFLFTDLEEVGLFGAEAFVSQYQKLNEIGLILNFESRGNAGPSLTFEVSKNNSWLMDQYIKATGNSFANSFGYEIYKVMPNDTDFSMFRTTGIEGFNSAFIDGFSYYHSMADNVENMDVRSLQNHGNILIKSLRHFGNLSLDTPHEAVDAIFFNPIASWLVIYPIAWDVPFIVITIILFGLATTLGIKRNRISIKKTFLGAAFFLGFMVTSLIFVWMIEKLVLMIYPLYTNFDSSNSYNASYYLVAIVGIVLLSCSFWYSKRASAPLFESYFVGGIFILIILMITFKILLPTGAYLLHYPLIISLLVYLFLLLMDIRDDNKPIAYGFMQMLSLIPALSLWVPVIYLVFITFSHAMPFGAVLITSFAISLFIPSLPLISSFNRRTVLSISLLLIILGFLLGHINSGYTKNKPLQTFLTYVLDADINKASWISEQDVPDEWMQQYIPSKAKDTVELYANVKWMMWKADATLFSTGVGNVKVLIDTTSGSTRNLTLLITADSTTNSIDFTVPQSAEIREVNNRLLPGKITRLNYSAISTKGIEVKLEANVGEPLNLKLIERKIGLPAEIVTKRLPENMIYGPGRLSNTIQVKRTIVL